MNKIYLILVLILTSNLAKSQVQVIEDNEKACREKREALNQRVLNDEIVKKYSKGDTLFVVFKKSKITSTATDVQKTASKGLNTTIYYKYSLKEDSFSFNHPTYYDFDKIEADKKTVVLTKDENYLKGKTVLDNAFFKTYSKYKDHYFLSMLSAIKSSKKITFIVDEAESLNGKITLRQIWLHDASNTFFMTKI